MAIAGTASATPIVDLVALDSARSDLERQQSEVGDKIREATHIAERNNKTINDATTRLKHHGPGMLQEDKDVINRSIATATVARDAANRDVTRLTKDQRTLATAMTETREAIDAVYSAMRREMMSAGTSIDPAGKSFREGVFSTVHELQELEGLSFFLYNPRAEATPHFTTWEQKATSLVRTMTDKFTSAHRAIINALNRVAAGCPELAAHDYLWGTLVADAETALLVAAARVLEESLDSLRRVLDGEHSEPMFSINAKLTANAKLVLAPGTSELWKLLQPIIHSAFDVLQLPPIGSATTVQAKKAADLNEADRPKTAGRRAAASPHNGPMAARIGDAKDLVTALKLVPAVASQVQAVQNTCRVLDQRIADLVSQVESSYGHLWAASMPDMTLSQLEISRRTIELDSALEAGTPVGDALLLNTYPLFDTLLSMISQQEGKLRAAHLAQQLEEVASAYEDTAMATLRRTLPASILPAGIGGASTATPKRPAVLGTAAPKAPEMRLDAAKPAEDCNGKEEPNRTTPRERQSAAAKPAADAAPVAPTHLAATDLGQVTVSPRPSTTPVGTRNRGPAAQQARPTAAAGSSRSPAPAAAGTAAAGGGPSTPNPKAGSVGRTSTAPHETASGASQRSSGTRLSQAWDSPDRAAGPPPPARAPHDPPSPASAARVSATLHMSSPPPSPTSEQPPARAQQSELDRLAAKERESLDRLKQMRLQAERRQRALMEEAPAAPTPKEIAARDETQRNASSPPSSGRATHKQSTSLPPLGTPRGSTPVKAATSPTTAAPATEAMTTDPEERRRERAAALQRERVQRERELLLESHRAQERRREEERSRAQTDMEAKIRAEQARRQHDLAADREAAERRREAADSERKKRDQQRRADEQRESELRQRLDELERRRKSDQRRFTDERSVGSPTRPDSRGGKPESTSTAAGDVLGGVDRDGHHAQPVPAAYGAATTTTSNSALRKKLGLPPGGSGANTPSTSAPNSGRGPLPPVGSRPGSSPPDTMPPRVPPAASGSRPMSRDEAAASPGLDGSMPAIDPTGKSHLEVYRAYCSALGIKPNSGLMKTLPNQPGRHCTTINLDLNYIGVRGVRPLIEILKLNRGLELLNLKDNNLENAEVRQVVNVLMGESGASITHLDLSNNPISLAGGSAIMDLVARQPTLRTVILKGTLIQAKVVEKITDAASRNPGA